MRLAARLADLFKDSLGLGIGRVAHHHVGREPAESKDYEVGVLFRKADGLERLGKFHRDDEVRSGGGDARRECSLLAAEADL
ncbi:hypothetical protein SDC9_178667 [bioreactor metagenome]|uniref:Uncharacterized protein n=1 Tax=bioreactor metagenome TaxID=1076179 RepID=A0A645H5S4_9ZZZZ